MMKKSILWGLWPMLLSLVITATPQNGNANPMDSPIDHLMMAQPIRNGIANPMESLTDPLMIARPKIKRNANSESCTKMEPKEACLVKDISGGIEEVLKEMDSPINHNMENKYNKIISDLEEKLHQLPNEVDNVIKSLGKEMVLFRLYEASDSIIRTKSKLTTTADNLKKHCQDLIDIFEDNPNYLDVDIVKYTAEEFNTYAKLTKDRLEDASKEYKRVKTNINKAKSELKVFSSKLNETKNKLKNKGKRKKRSIVHHDRNKRFIWLLIPIIISWFKGTDYTKTIKMIEETERVLQSLESQNEKVQDFIEKELDLITKWEQSLDTAISRKYHELSKGKIKFGIKIIKNSLYNLRTACEDYLKHTLPDILKANQSRTKRNIPYINQSLQPIHNPIQSYTKRNIPYINHSLPDVQDPN